MKLKIVLTCVNIVVFVINLRAQTAQEYLSNCVEDAMKNGANKIIMSATLCSACEGVFEGFIFSEYSETDTRLRYIKYFDGYREVKVIVDTVFRDQTIKNIFRLEETFHDSIAFQITRMDSLLVIESNSINGEKVYQMPINHGKMRYVGVFSQNSSTVTIDSVINLNSVFEKAYYYWLLCSSISNYKIDLLNIRLHPKG